jgi:Tol biopolymer transport system component
MAKIDFQEPRLQSWLKYFVIGATVFLTASACQTQHKASEATTEPVPPTPAPAPGSPRALVLPKLPTPYPGILQLTQVGDNSQARFSLDGTRLIYISRLRPSHKHAQVYELTFPQQAGNPMTERRLTFHDGDDLEPVLTPDGQSFYYASGTDELKEEAVATEKLMRNYYPEGLRNQRKGQQAAGSELLTEIYLQTANGRDIERLTTMSGYDGDVDLDPKTGKHTVYTSTRDGRSTLFLADAKLNNVRKLTDGKYDDRGARFSPDGKSLVWSRTLQDSPLTTQILIADGNFKQPRELVGGAGAMIQPTWHPNGRDIIFSANRDGKNFNLYVIDREGKCLKRLTVTPSDQMQPTVSPDGQRVLFTGRSTESSQLFVIDYRPGDICLPIPQSSVSTAAPAAPTPASTPIANPTVPAPASPTPVATATPTPLPTPVPTPPPATDSSPSPAP